MVLVYCVLCYLYCKIRLGKLFSLAYFMYSINEPIHMHINAIHNNYIFSVISNSK
nr:MAG TPA: hypothetical protein [Caudoviricetes sp.]